jgi:hypothetical protein
MSQKALIPASLALIPAFKVSEALPVRCLYICIYIYIERERDSEQSTPPLKGPALQSKVRDTRQTSKRALVCRRPTQAGARFSGLPALSGLEAFAFGPSRLAFAFGPSRLAFAFGPSRLAFAFGPSRLAFAFGPSRFAFAFGPSRFAVLCRAYTLLSPSRGGGFSATT